MVLLVASRAALAARRHAPGTSHRRARMVSPRPPRRLGGADRGAARRHAGADPGLRPGQLSRLDPRDPQPQRAERTRSRRDAVHRGEHRQSLGHDRPGAARRLRHHLAHHHAVQSLDGRADRRRLGACAQALARICMRSSFPTPCCSSSPARLLASFLPGLPGLLATGLAGALLFAYVLQGLAVIHVYSRGVPLPPASARRRSISEFCCWAGWPSSSPSSASPSLCINLRHRAGPGRQPPRNDGTM